MQENWLRHPLELNPKRGPRHHGQVTVQFRPTLLLERQLHGQGHQGVLLQHPVLLKYLSQRHLGETLRLLGHTVENLLLVRPRPGILEQGFH